MYSGYEFTERWEVDTAVDLWISNEASATERYGDINTWDVSAITNFSYLFYGATFFNKDIGDWDVSSGTNFSGMFAHSMSFNQDIGDWNVSSGNKF